MIIKSLKALGLYGGASLNSIELALVDTDGLDVKNFIKETTIMYPENLSLDIRHIISRRNWSFTQLEEDAKVQKIRDLISEFHAQTINDFIEDEEVDHIGVDSLTIFNDPMNKCSYQIEDGHKICSHTQCNIVTHFHKADLLSGGQASPLTPSFFNAIAQGLPHPILFIDLEAVCSLIYIGTSGEMIAFDCAPGLAMIEDWTFRHANMQTDYNGKLAVTGNVHKQIVDSLLHHKILRKQPPKSLDILCFGDKKEHLEGLTLEDGAATATFFIAEAVYQAALDFLPAIPENIYIAGMGITNPSLIRFIKQNFAPRQVKSVLEINHRLTKIGAQATAFNTVRRIYGLPLTYPTTTGITEPMTGGEIYEKK